MSSEKERPVAWLRAQIEADLAAAQIISSGGFSPQRWDTEPPGQVNPAEIPQDAAVTAALGCEPEYICGWVQLVAYGKLNNEPDEAYSRDSDAPFALVDNGRREFDHIIRHDPRNVVARCEAELGILDLHKLVIADRGDSYDQARGQTYRVVNEDPDEKAMERLQWSTAFPACRECRKRFPCRTVCLVAAGYGHRPGYRQEWAP